MQDDEDALVQDIEKLSRSARWERSETARNRRKAVKEIISHHKHKEEEEALHRLEAKHHLENDKKRKKNKSLTTSDS